MRDNSWPNTVEEIENVSEVLKNIQLPTDKSTWTNFHRGIANAKAKIKEKKQDIVLDDLKVKPKEGGFTPRVKLWRGFNA